MKRAGHGRWSKAKEKIFFEELAATNNITRSAAAAGVSPNAVRARRLKHRLFRAKWDAVVENARATIDLYLVEESRKTFDPEELDTGDVEPKVSIDQAIRISQLGRGGGGGGRKAKQAEPDPFDEEQEEEDAPGDPELVADMVHRMVAKLRRLRERDMPENIAQGWQFDEAHDVMIPPGWVRSEPRAA